MKITNKKLTEAFELYQQNEIVMAGMSSKTLESYANASKLATRFFGDVDITSLEIGDIVKFAEHLRSWQRPDTVRGNLMCLRSVLRYCSRKGVPVLDVEDIHIPKREKRVVSYLHESEAVAFRRAIAQKRVGYARKNRLRNIAMTEVLYSSGIRVSELCRLNRNSIHDRQFTVIGKSSAPRLCFITKRAEKAIADYLAIRDDASQALFVTKGGARITPSGVRVAFKKACERKNLDAVSPHMLRHSFATRMLERNVDIRYIGEMLGHQSLDTTLIYTHVENSTLKKVYEKAQKNLAKNAYVC